MGYNDKYPDMSAMYSIMFETEDKLKNKIKELEAELERTRKALDVAKHALQRIQFRGSHSKFWVGKDDGTIALKALEQITAILENKNGKC